MKNIKVLSAEPVLVNDTELAKLLSVSVSHIHGLDNSGKIPQAVFLGKSRRWVLSEIKSWAAAGCPARGTAK